MSAFNTAAASSSVGTTRSLPRCPRTLTVDGFQPGDPDHAVLDVDVLPAQSIGLAAPHPGVVGQVEEHAQLGSGEPHQALEVVPAENVVVEHGVVRKGLDLSRHVAPDVAALLGIREEATQARQSLVHGGGLGGHDPEPVQPLDHGWPATPRAVTSQEARDNSAPHRWMALEHMCDAALHGHDGHRAPRRLWSYARLLAVARW